MLDKERIPRHVAIIMDGNGRWATKHGVPRLAGHNAGMKAMKEIVKRSHELGVQHLTVYAFSTENWKRSAEEVSGIFGLLVTYVESELREISENNVRIRILGDTDALPEKALKAVNKAINNTAGNTGLQFNIALNYGGREEIRRAAAELAEEAKAGRIDPDAITDEDISRRLFTGEDHAGCGDPDVIIRTSGEERLSNFLLWQCAYSEFVFVDDLWPDFTPERYEEALEIYQNRNRRYGGRTPEKKG